MTPPATILLSTSERHRLFWKLQIAGWGGIALLTAVVMATGYFGWRDAILLGGFRTLFGFGATLLLRYYYRSLRRRMEGRPWLFGFEVLLVCAAVAMADGILMKLFADLVGTDLERQEVFSFILVSPPVRWMFYCLWSVLYFSISYWLDTQDTLLRLARAETAAKVSELEALRAQVDPHFLFNALGSILAEAESPQSVRRLTLALSDYLRFSLQQRRENEPLDGELTALEHYLQVEQARFDEDFAYTLEIEPAARQVSVPHALVQPLLENAIKYGQRSEIRPVRIHLAARLKAGFLHVSVTNTGAWVPPEENRHSTQVGLSNLRRRLQLIYGEAAQLEIRTEPEQVTVEVSLPLPAAPRITPLLMAKRKQS